MGTEAIWVPALIAAVGAGASMYNTNRVEKKQDNALAAQLRGNAERQRAADSKTAELIQKTSQSNPNDERAQSLEGFLRQIKAGQSNANAGLQQGGAVSDAYKQSGADAALGISNYGQNLAGLISRIDAPNQQRVNEAAEAVRFGDAIDQIKRVNAGEDFLAQLRLRGIRRNPWIDLAAGAAQGAAKGYAGAGTFGDAGAWSGTSPISGVNTIGSSTGWQGNSAFGSWGGWMN